MEKSQYWEGRIPWYSAKDMKVFRLGASTMQVTEDGACHGTRQVPADTVLVLVRGMMLNRAFPVCITTSRSCFNQDIKAIIASPSHQPAYLAYLLTARERRFLSQVDRSSHGTGRLQTEALRSALLPFPPRYEQQRITEILSTCDDAIQSTRGLIAAKEQQKKALMQQLLAGSSRLRGRRSPWRSVPFSRLFARVTRLVPMEAGNSYRLISIRRRGGGVFERGVHGGESIAYPELNAIHENDFLVSKRQVTHGAVAVVPSSFAGAYVSNEYTIFEKHEVAPISMHYFAWLTRTRELWHMAHISSNGVHIEKLIFAPTHFLKQQVRIPGSVVEQEAIAEVLTTADREIVLLESKLAALKQQKRGLMQKLLTGQVRVKL